MILTRTLLFVGLVLFPLSCTQTTHPWQNMVERDLKEIRKQVLRHHPGPLDSLNPDFNRWLEDGYEASLEKLKTISTFSGYRFALHAYVNGFHDGHLQLWQSLKMKKGAWPKFIIAKRGDKFIVHHSETQKPKPGWVLVSCDGKAPRQLMEQNVFPYQGNPSLEAHWIELTPTLFVDKKNPFFERPINCTFESQKGQQTFDLTWNSVWFAQIQQALSNAGFGPKPQQSISVTQKHTWVSLPRFDPNAEQSKHLEQIIRRLKNARKSRLVVFDVRGNGGGNSEWGRKIIHSFYGKDFAQSRLNSQGKKEVYVEWRVSDENQAHLAAVVPRLITRFGDQAEISQVFSAVAKGMLNAPENKLYRQPKLSKPKPQSELYKRTSNPVQAKVFLLTDGRCASACLDFVDQLKAMPNVTHVGSATSADTLYMDIRTLRLPSSVSELSLPMKVYRNRKRANNQAYHPDKVWTSDLWDTKSIKAWITDLVSSAQSSK